MLIINIKHLKSQGTLRWWIKKRNVGGKLEENEDSLEGAYRELEEETGITKDDTILTYLMNFEYKLLNMQLQVFVGKLNKEKTLVEEVNKLYWMDLNENFFDEEKFAGEGNIGHMLCQVNINKKQIFEGD